MPHVHRTRSTPRSLALESSHLQAALSSPFHPAAQEVAASVACLEEQAVVAAAAVVAVSATQATVSSMRVLGKFELDGLDVSG